MKGFVFKIGVVLILLAGAIFYYIYLADFTIKEDKEFIKKIENLERKIDSLSLKKDSVRNVIDSTHVKIITNEKHFKERVTTIISEPDSFSESFTRQYILDYASSRGYHIHGTSEIK